MLRFIFERLFLRYSDVKCLVLGSVFVAAHLGAFAQVSSEAMATEPANDSDPWSYPQTDEPISLEELQVSASISSLASERGARIMTILPMDAIKVLPVNSVVDVLKLASGVDVRQRGGFGVQSDISLDGGTYDQVSILLNGVNITSPQTGHYSADWPLTLSDIWRIEIIEGAASRYMGNSSLLGAINVMTRIPDSSSLSFKAEGGSYGSAGAESRLGLKAGNTAHSLSGAFKRSDGGTVNSEFRRYQAYYHGTLQTSFSDFFWQAGFSDLDHGANTFYSGAYPNQHDNLRRYIVSASAATKGTIKVEPMVYWQRLYDHYQLIHNSPIGENFHRNEVIGAKLGLSTHWALGRTALGGELRREAVISTTLGKPLDRPVAANDSVDYKYRDHRTALNINLEHVIALGSFNASAGLTAAMNTGYDHRLRLYPGVDASYSLSRHWRVYASWGRAFRMPTFTDLYYKSPTHEGNRDLKPELMNSWQCGVQMSTAAVGVRANAFVHRGRNMIDWVMYTPDDEFHATGFNLDNYGASIETHVRFQDWLGENQPLLYLDASYTYMHQHRRDPVVIYESRSALEYLRHKFTANLSHRFWRGATVTWSVRWQDRMGDFLLYTDGVSQGRLEPYRPYATLDVKIDYTPQERWLLSLSATNLTNNHYYDCANIPQPGLWIMGSVTYTLPL